MPHLDGCPKRNSLYADCKCDQVALNNLTDQVRESNGFAMPIMEALESLRVEVTRLASLIQVSHDQISCPKCDRMRDVLNDRIVDKCPQCGDGIYELKRV